MEMQEFTKIGRQLFTGISKPVDLQMLADMFEKHGHLTKDQWDDVCKSYRESSNKYPYKPDIAEMVRIKGYGRQNKQYPIIIVECPCGQSFAVQQEFLQSENSYDCPGKNYSWPGTTDKMCNRNYSSGFLRRQTAENGVIRIPKDTEHTFDVKYFNEPAERELQ